MPEPGPQRHSGWKCRGAEGTFGKWCWYDQVTDQTWAGEEATGPAPRLLAERVDSNSKRGTRQRSGSKVSQFSLGCGRGRPCEICRLGGALGLKLEQWVSLSHPIRGQLHSQKPDLFPGDACRCVHTPLLTHAGARPTSIS